MQAIFFNPRAGGYIGEGTMKVASILIFFAVYLAAASTLVSPALAWDWPIFGFGPGPGAPLENGPLPSAILPGTVEWASQPGCAVQLVLPGYAYGLDAFQGSIGFGPVFRAR